MRNPPALEREREHSHRARGSHAADRALEFEERVVFTPVPRGERAVARERLRARGAPVEHQAQLAPAGEAEVQGGTNPLGGQGQAVTGGVTGEEHAVLDGRTQLVGDPVALIAVGR